MAIKPKLVILGPGPRGTPQRYVLEIETSKKVPSARLWSASVEKVGGVFLVSEFERDRTPGKPHNPYSNKEKAHKTAHDIIEKIAQDYHSEWNMPIDDRTKYSN